LAPDHGCNQKPGEVIHLARFSCARLRGTRWKAPGLD